MGHLWSHFVMLWALGQVCLQLVWRCGGPGLLQRVAGAVWWQDFLPERVGEGIPAVSPLRPGHRPLLSESSQGALDAASTHEQRRLPPRLVVGALVEWNLEALS